MRYWYPDLSVYLLEKGAEDFPEICARKSPLAQDHKNASKEDDDTVADVPEHDCEQEWEGNDSEETRVDFLVRCDTITIHYSLETLGKLIRALERWGSLAGANFVENGRNTRAGLLLCGDIRIIL